MIIFLPFYYQQLLFFFSYWEKNSPTGKTKHLFILLFLNDYTIQKRRCVKTKAHLLFLYLNVFFLYVTLFSLIW